MSENVKAQFRYYITHPIQGGDQGQKVKNITLRNDAQQLSSAVQAQLLNFQNDRFDFNFKPNLMESRDDLVGIGVIEILDKENQTSEPLDSISISIQRNGEEDMIVLTSSSGGRGYNPSGKADPDKFTALNEALKELVSKLFNRFDASVLVTTHTLDPNPPKTLQEALACLQDSILTILSPEFWDGNMNRLASILGAISRNAEGNLEKCTHETIGAP